MAEDNKKRIRITVASYKIWLKKTARLELDEALVQVLKVEGDSLLVIFLLRMLLIQREATRDLVGAKEKVIRLVR